MRFGEPSISQKKNEVWRTLDLTGLLLSTAVAFHFRINKKGPSASLGLFPNSTISLSIYLSISLSPSFEKKKKKKQLRNSSAEGMSAFYEDRLRLHIDV